MRSLYTLLLYKFPGNVKLTDLDFPCTECISEKGLEGKMESR